MKPNGSAAGDARNATNAPAGAFGAGELLTIEEVAQMLKVPTSWVYERTRRRAADRIPGFRLGKYWRFRQADVIAWLEHQRVGAKNV